MLFDPGLQPERTLLAWRRTCLSFAAASAVAAKLLVGEIGAAAIVMGIAGVVVSAACAVVAQRQYRRTTDQLGRWLPSDQDGSSIAALTLGAAIVGLLGAAYVVLRGMGGG